MDAKKYEEVQKSFSVQNKIARAKKMTEDYKIQATPTLIVNGRFSIQQTAGPERLFANIDQLIVEARVANKLSAPAAAASPATATGTATKSVTKPPVKK